MRRLAGLNAGKGLPEIVDRRAQVRHLVGQPLGVILLCCKGVLDRLYVVLEHLQLVDRLLLRLIQRLGLFDELLGCLQGPRLQEPDRQDAILFGRITRKGTP